MTNSASKGGVFETVVQRQPREGRRRPIGRQLAEGDRLIEYRRDRTPRVFERIGDGSYSRVAHPASSPAWAIPCPIVPAPRTHNRSNHRGGSPVDNRELDDSTEDGP